jgi:hypothetical protein
MAVDVYFLWIDTEFCQGTVPLIVVFKMLTILGQMKARIESSKLSQELDICERLSPPSPMNSIPLADFGGFLRMSAYAHLTLASRIERFIFPLNEKSEEVSK